MGEKLELIIRKKGPEGWIPIAEPPQDYRRLNTIKPEELLPEHYYLLKGKVADLMQRVFLLPREEIEVGVKSEKNKELIYSRVLPNLGVNPLRIRLYYQYYYLPRLEPELRAGLLISPDEGINQDAWIQRVKCFLDFYEAGFPIDHEGIVDDETEDVPSQLDICSLDTKRYPLYIGIYGTICGEIEI